MAMIRHPLTRAEYLRLEDGHVQVTGPDGVWGIFDRQGNWVDGKRRLADRALCYWVARAPEVKPPARGISIRLNSIEVKGASS